MEWNEAACRKSYDTGAWLEKIDKVIQQGPYQPDYESLSRHKTPDWFRDAKFGIFLHWGLYSVPAYRNEWYSRNMYIQGTPEYEHHVKTYGPQDQFGYRDFIPMFHAEKFDPDAWIDLLQKSGARYVVPVAEHHDGFQMYRSELSHWNAYEMGPHRDLVGELLASAERKGMIPCASTHRIEHWFFFDHGRMFPSDVQKSIQKGDFYWPAVHVEEEDFTYNHDAQPAPSDEFLTDWMIRTVEIIDRFHPRELYFDWWIMQKAAKPYLKKILCYYYNRAAEWNVDVMAISKMDAVPIDVAVPDIERGQFAAAQVSPWQTDTAAAKNSWCYTRQNIYKKPEVILADFVDVIAKNGCMLLNVGPKADGTFSEEDTRILLAIGDWMHRNAEAIYGSRPWKIAAEGPTAPKVGNFSDGTDTVFTEHDFRFTVRGGNLYLFAMHLPKTHNLLVHSLSKKAHPTAADFDGIIEKVELVGYPEIGRDVFWKQTEQGLHLVTPEIKTDNPVVFCIRFV